MGRGQNAPRLIFVATGACAGLTNSRDSRHVAALFIQTGIAPSRWHEITTRFMLAGTHALLIKRMDSAQALRMVKE